MKTIMVVDDSAAIRYLVGITLRGGGYEVIEAADGREALEQLNRYTVHLIVSDLNMPGMDGLGLLREVKKRPDHKFTPFVVMTTDDSGARKAEGQAAGAKSWIVKPFIAKRLLQVVSKLLAS